jgi:hypothetical protein
VGVHPRHDREDVTFTVRHDDGSKGAYEAQELQPLLRGFLLRGFDGTTLFRVYKMGHSSQQPSFDDYEIAHSDLEIEILGEYGLYERDGKLVLDHCPEALGVTRPRRN